MHTEVTKPAKPEARLMNPKYDRPLTRRPCAGCGGEKFEPPQTPAQMEAILREHVQEN